MTRTSWRGRGRGARSNLGLQGRAACARAVAEGKTRGGGRSPCALLLRTRVLFRVLSEHPRGAHAFRCLAPISSRVSRVIRRDINRYLGWSGSFTLSVLRSCFYITFIISLLYSFCNVRDRSLPRTCSPEWITMYICITVSHYHCFFDIPLSLYLHLVSCLFTFFSSLRDETVSIMFPIAYTRLAMSKIFYDKNILYRI